jgi:hypothetical protein
LPDNSQKLFSAYGYSSSFNDEREDLHLSSW